MGETRSRLSGWLRNSNRNPQHTIDHRQSDFQACSFNHSDISPCLNSTTCERSGKDYPTRRRFPLCFLHRVSFQRVRPRERERPAEIVSDPSISRDHFQRFRRGGVASAPAAHEELSSTASDSVAGAGLVLLWGVEAFHEALETRRAHGVRPDQSRKVCCISR